MIDPQTTPSAPDAHAMLTDTWQTVGCQVEDAATGQLVWTYQPMFTGRGIRRAREAGVILTALRRRDCGRLDLVAKRARGNSA